MLQGMFIVFTITNSILPFILSSALVHYFAPTTQQYQLIKAFSLLLLGMFLSSLATLNFSLAFLVGLFAAPLTYLQPLAKRPVIAGILAVPLSLLAPPMVVIAGTRYWGLGIGKVLKEAAYGWDVWGMNTQVVVWCVWWPAWLVGMVLLFGRPRSEIEGGEVVKGVKS